MRKVLFISFCFWFPLQAMAQGGVVSAPALEAIESANKATLAKQLVEAVKQSGTLAKSYEQLQQVVKLYYDVSDFLKNADVVKAAVNRQIDLVNTAAAALKRIASIKGVSAESARQAQYNIHVLMNVYKENMDLITQVIKGEIFKMTDGERINILQRVEEKTEKSIAKVNCYQAEFVFTSSMKALVKSL